MLAGSLMVVFACGGEALVVTGGFEERVVDKRSTLGGDVVVADLDGDGVDEVIAAYASTEVVNVYARGETLEDAWEAIPISGIASFAANTVVTGDLDGDGDLDVAATNAAAADVEGARGELVWYENPGELRGIWQTHVVSGATLIGPNALAAGDVDGDGLVDLVVGTSTDAAVGWFVNAGAGRFTGPVPVDATLIGASDLALVDFDEDGRTDVLVASDRSQQLLYLRNTSTSTSPGRFTRYVVATGEQFDSLTVANLDGDDAPELLVGATVLGTEVATGTVSAQIFDLPDTLGDPWPSRRVFDNLITEEGTSPAGLHVATGDFDGDGSTDVVIATTAPGDVDVFFNRGTEFEANPIRRGYRGIQDLEVADIDGDGRVDFLTNTSGFATRDRLAWWRNVGP
ncbi:MAG: VCBS repeat-containing protein [Deltaproteobacteria bacterium]